MVPPGTALTEDREIRKSIAAEAQTSPLAASSPAVRAFQFFLAPLLIVAACAGVYALLSLLMGRPRPAHDWLRDLKEGGPNTRHHAALQLAQALRRQEKPDRGLTPDLMAVYRSAGPKEDEIRQYLAMCLGCQRDPLAVDLLLEGALKDPSSQTRAACIDALGAIGDPRALPDLVKLLDAGDGVVRRYAAFNAAAVAGAAKDRSVVEPLKKALRDPRADVGWNAAFGLAYFLGDGSGAELLAKMLDRKYLSDTVGSDPYREHLIAHVMKRACDAAARMEDRSFLPKLRQVGLNDPDAEVRFAAQKAETELSKERR